MIQPHLFYQIYLSFLEQNDWTPPQFGELSDYTDSAHTEVEDLSSRYMNGSNFDSNNRFNIYIISIITSFFKNVFLTCSWPSKLNIDKFMGKH